MKLSEKIYIYRKKLGLSQEALAEKMDVSRQAVSKWETGEATPDLQKIVPMAALFGVTTDHLLSEEEPKEENHYTYSSFDTHREEPVFTAPVASPPPKPNPHRHDWVIGVVIACIGAGLILFGSAALIIMSLLTGAPNIIRDITTVFEQEVEVYPDGSVPLPWADEMDEFFGNSDALKEWLESQEGLMTDTSSVETQTEATAAPTETEKED